MEDRAIGQATALAREYAEVLRDRLGDAIERIVLFGSRARGEARPGSDFDVLVVVHIPRSQAREAVIDAGVTMMDRHEALFAAVLYDREQWANAQAFPLAWRIAEEGIPL
jgi:predicted nucleotidyltransferase